MPHLVLGHPKNEDQKKAMAFRSEKSEDEKRVNAVF